jgi:hypothetical protein
MKLLHRPVALLAVCAAAVFAAGGCVASTAPIDGESEANGQVADALGTEEQGAPEGGRTTGVDGLRAKTVPQDGDMNTSAYSEQADPDPEPWHGGKAAGSTSTPGKHD